MRRYIVALISLNALIFVLSARAEEAGYSMGPLTLCRGETVEIVAYNPAQLSRELSAKIVDFDSGRTRYEVETFVGTQRGVRLQAGLDGIEVDGRRRLQTTDCGRPEVVTVVVTPADDPGDAQPIAFSGRLLTAQDMKEEQIYARRTSFGAVRAFGATRATTTPFFVGAESATLRVANLGSTSAVVTALVRDAVGGSALSTTTFVVAAGESAGRVTGYFTEVSGLGSEHELIELDIQPETPGAQLDTLLAVSLGTANDTSIGTEEITIVHEFIERTQVQQDGRPAGSSGDVAMEELTIANEGFKMDQKRVPIDRRFFQYNYFNAVSTAP